MDVHGVDPRDISWEIVQPVYRVYFWGLPGPSAAQACDERRITHADDVGEVLTWAHHHAEGRVFVVYAEAGDGGARGLLRLYGEDPSLGDGGTPGVPASAAG
ncbi:hypothetical protein GTR02_01415 [Kineococcus sp. R8]|uniref:hypothetical protein n=1 Tax=Kineococcus siccus TaxID=2696567 RepID=UPI001412E884|nr:hypothetical protein [Kineococcus siccus]NAZ80477.1 hypothetical protein [Kineococcus siccus]